MTLLTVLHFPDPRLRKKASAIKSVDKNIEDLSANMLETMYHEGGIGLAATQVNVQQRLIVMDLSENKNEPQTLINPEIIERDGSESSQEGCLSVPGYYESIERAEKIKYQYLSITGEKVEAETDGLTAICIQHEIDHLDGKLFIDYLSPLKQQRIRKKLEKQERLDARAL